MCLILGLQLLFSLALIQNVSSENETETATFRPFYSPYGEGTIAVDPNTNLTSLTREWNFEGWNVTSLYIKMRFCVPELWVTLGGGSHLDPAFELIVYISTDNGTTYPYEFWYEVGYLIYTKEKMYGGWCYNDYWHSMFHPMSSNTQENITDLLTPNSTMIINLHRSWYSPYPFYIGTTYWGAIQEPIPPYDYIDAEDTYVQYYIQFYCEYTEDQIEYQGETFDFPYSETEEKLHDSANMIINCMQDSGAVNEVVGKTFGKDTWIVLYSSELAMLNLLKMCSIIPDKANDYLVTVKHFIPYLWSKMESNGSFPFILTDGDQHEWYNETSGDYYGKDHIDSFSALAISLMAEYHNATGDIDFINSYWNQIIAAKEFLYDLVNQTYWLPHDGYHYNHTADDWYLSEWSLLHDACEVYQGFKDLSYMFYARGNTSDGDYWNNFADSIANGIRTYFWNETELRYTGYFHIPNATQNTVEVYNIITPVIYRIETNTTRISYSVNAYIHWGILSGRYLNQKWATDYSVYNEYSTMSGMIYSAFYHMIIDHNYNVTTWMKDSFLEISKFLFQNPIYPNKNLQNDNGWLDYVNLVNYTYARDTARLIESSAWIIDGMYKLFNMTDLFTYDYAELIAINDTLTQQETFWENKGESFKNEYGHEWNEEMWYSKWVEWLKDQDLYVDWYDYLFLKYLFDEGYLEDDVPWWEDDLPPDWIEKSFVQGIPNYVPLFCGVFGLICIMFTPYYIIKKLKEGEYSTGIGYGMLLFIIAIGLIIFWLWG